MLLFHFSNQILKSVIPACIGNSIHAGREISNQFCNGLLLPTYLYKSNFFTEKSDFLELHRFGGLNLHTAIIDHNSIYDMDKGFLTDIEIQNLKLKGYTINNQVRLFDTIDCKYIGKLIPRNWKTIGKQINGKNLLDNINK